MPPELKITKEKDAILIIETADLPGYKHPETTSPQPTTITHITETKLIENGQTAEEYHREQIDWFLSL